MGAERKRKHWTQRIREENQMLREEKERLEREVEALQGEIASWKERYLRTLADFDNYRKAQEQRWKLAVDTANERLIRDLLVVLDHFEQALQAMDGAADVEAVRRGVEMIYRQLQNLLEKEGLERVDAKGLFDPSFHEALDVVEREDLPDGAIVDVLQPGYRLKGKLLRPARVRVNRRKEGGNTHG